MTTSQDGPAAHLAAAIAAFRRRAWQAADAGSERDVRKARVAARRLRAILRLATAPELEALRAEIAELSCALGTLRDLDVQLAAIEHEREAATGAARLAALSAVLEILAGERASSRLMLAALSAKPRFRRLGASLDRLAAELPALEVRSPSARSRQLARRRRRVRELGGAIDPASDSEQYHALRIAVKRLRYTLEVLDPDLGALDELRALQALLGDHQDACVAEARLRGIARTAALENAVKDEIERIADERAEAAAALRGRFPKVYEPLRRR